MPRSLVVGASGELGGAVARELFRLNHSVVVHGFENASALDEVAVSVSADKSFLVDVTDQEAVERMLVETGTIDNLIYCSGVNPTAEKIVDIELSLWRRVIDVNLTGAFVCIQAALPSLRRSDSASIVLVSSIFGLQTPARRAAYGASKHGLTGLVQALTKEEGSWLQANVVCPGPMWSENLRQIVERHALADGISVEEYVLSRVADIPAGRLMELEECASVIAFLCTEESKFVRGESLRISGGAVR